MTGAEIRLQAFHKVYCAFGTVYKFYLIIYGGERHGSKNQIEKIRSEEVTIL